MLSCADEKFINHFEVFPSHRRHVVTPLLLLKSVLLICFAAKKMPCFRKTFFLLLDLKFYIDIEAMSSSIFTGASGGGLNRFTAGMLLSDSTAEIKW